MYSPGAVSDRTLSLNQFQKKRIDKRKSEDFNTKTVCMNLKETIKKRIIYWQ